MSSREAHQLLFGTTRRGNEVLVGPKLRTTHMHVLGASGRGKSKFLEHLIRQDIRHGEGLCLIDPHGELCDDLVRWLAETGLHERRRIALVDPSVEGWSVGFNPLDFGPRQEIPFAVDAMVKACAQVWGGEDTTKTPLLKRALRLVYHALAEKRLTLLEAHALTQPHDQGGLRRYLTSDLRDPIIGTEWAALNSMPPARLDEFFSSTNNRLLEFLASELLRNIIGQRERVLDLSRAMEEQAIVLVNLAPRGRLSADNARLLGTLIVNDLLLKARQRPKGSAPFYLYVDECALFVNDDLGSILDETRKFGLHLVLAHQHLAQLRAVSERVYAAVMTNAQTKVVFGGLSPDDARVMAESVFMGEYDLEDVKHTYDSKQVARYARVWLESHARGESLGESESQGVSESMSLAEGSSTSEHEGAGTTRGSSEGTTRSATASSHRGTTRSSSFIHGSHEALMPVLETRPTQGYSLEEQVYRSMATMVNQGTQSAIVKLPMQRARRIRTPDVPESIARDERVIALKERLFRQADFVSPSDAVARELEARRLDLIKAAKQATEPETFRE